MIYKATITISNRIADAINNYLHNEPRCEEECLGEDDIIAFTATFSNGYQMDVKCCGVQYLENETNTAWTEAVLFNEHGVELRSTEPSEEYLGEWIINYDGNEYIVTVSTWKKRLVGLLYAVNDYYELDQPDVPESVQREIEKLLEPYINSDCSVTGTATDISYEIEGWDIHG